jgi:hypothetical protein
MIKQELLDTLPQKYSDVYQKVKNMYIYENILDIFNKNPDKLFMTFDIWALLKSDYDVDVEDYKKMAAKMVLLKKQGLIERVRKGFYKAKKEDFESARKDFL